MPQRDPGVYLEDIEHYAAAAIRFTFGFSLEQYLADEKTRAAVERVLEVCGEAMSNLYRVAPAVAESIPHARDIIGFRNIRGQQMKKATIRIRRETQTALKEMGERFVRAWKTGKSDGDLLQFESPAALFRVLTAKRWELIERLQTTGPTTLRGLARELDRDVKRVHEDVSTLIKHGLVARAPDRKICVPYDVIHADFDLRAVA